MAGLTIRLFGGFELIASSGHLISLPTRRTRSLIALLARHPGMPHTREKLAGALWFDSDERGARTNLRQALKLVRRSLEDQDRPAIISEGDTLALAGHGVDVDVDRFERLLEMDGARALEQAAELYRGDFLDGSTLVDGPFADWSLVERVRLRERALGVFSALLAQRCDAGRSELAVEAALRLLALDPLQESVHRRLIQLYLGQGRRGSALVQYQECINTLERELGIGPEPETVRLFQAMRVRHAQPTSCGNAAAASARAESSPDLASVNALLARPALAVLPFAELGDPSDQGHFAAGLCEDIITALAGWRSFPVIASSSTCLPRDEVPDVRAVSSSLNASYLVDGSIRRSAERIRITVRLVEGSSARQLWGERLDFDYRDMLVLQDQIARQIAAIVGPELERAEFARITLKRTDDLAAWEHCLRGTALLQHCTTDGNARARNSFRRALDLDPEYGDAFTGMAYGYLRDLHGQGGEDRATLLAEGHEAAQRAVVLDGNSSTAHLALATAHVWTERFDVVIPETELAIELNPSNAAARMALGNRLDLIGRTSEGVQQMSYALELNPRDPRRFTYMGFLARAHIALEEFAVALEWARKAVQLRPDLPELHFRLAICLAHVDRAEQAEAALGECERLSPGFLSGQRTWRPYGDADRNAHFFDGLRRHHLLDCPPA